MRKVKESMYKPKEKNVQKLIEYLKKQDDSNMHFHLLKKED